MMLTCQLRKWDICATVAPMPAKVSVNGAHSCLECAYVRVRDVSYRAEPITIAYLEAVEGTWLRE